MNKEQTEAKNIKKSMFEFLAIFVVISIIATVITASIFSIKSAYAKGIDYLVPIPNTKWGTEYADNITLISDKNSNVVYYYDTNENTIITPFLSNNGKPCVLQDNRIVEADTNNLVMYVE